MSEIVDELRQRAQQWAVSTAVAQGLPPKVEDPVVLAQVALIQLIIIHCQADAVIIAALDSGVALIFQGQRDA